MNVRAALRAAVSGGRRNAQPAAAKRALHAMDRSVGAAQLAPALQPQGVAVVQAAVGAPVAAPVWGAYRGFPDSAMDAFKACVAGFPQAPRKALLDAAGRAQRAILSGQPDTASKPLLQAEQALLDVVDSRLLGAYQVLIGVADENDVGAAVLLRLMESASLARFIVPADQWNPTWWSRYDARLAAARADRIAVRTKREEPYLARAERAHDARLAEQRQRDQAQQARAAARSGRS